MPAWSTSSTATVRALSGLLSRVLRASMFSGAREMRVFEFSASRGKRNIGRATAATNRRISAQSNSPEIMKQTPFANFPLATEIFQATQVFLQLRISNQSTHNHEYHPCFSCVSTRARRSSRCNRCTHARRGSVWDRGGQSGRVRLDGSCTLCCSVILCTLSVVVGVSARLDGWTPTN